MLANLRASDVNQKPFLHALFYNYILGILLRSFYVNSNPPHW